MSTLNKSQKIFAGIDLIGNFIQQPLKVGDIVLSDDDQDLVWANIQDLVPGFSLADNVVVSNASDLKYTSESNIDVSMGGTVNSPVANGQVQLKFNAENSAFVSLKQITQTEVKLGAVDTVLKNYWKQQGWDGIFQRRKYHFIVEIIEAESGTVIFSQDKDNLVTLEGKNNIPINSVADLASGNIDLVTSTKSTLEIISQTKMLPLYRAVRLRGNGNFEIVN